VQRGLPFGVRKFTFWCEKVYLCVQESLPFGAKKFTFWYRKVYLSVQKRLTFGAPPVPAPPPARRSPPAATPSATPAGFASLGLAGNFSFFLPLLVVIRDGKFKKEKEN